jgi:Secretion system C-terminal sorting domain
MFRLGDSLVKTYSVVLKTILIMAVWIASAKPIFSQNIRMDWSAFSSAFGNPGSNTTAMRSSTGPPFIGSSQAVNNKVESGFLTARVLRNPATETPEQLSASLPTEFLLLQNFPNPFNPSTTIRYQLPVASHITLKVYDVLGREVAVLVDELQEAGSKSVVLNADRLASGTYFYRLQVSPMDGRESGSLVTTRKLLLMR